MPIEESGDRLILPRELPRQCVDLRLALRGQGCELGTVALEEGTGVGCLAPTIVRPVRQKAGDQRGHAPGDLPIDHVQLKLGLPTRLLHAG